MFVHGRDVSDALGERGFRLVESLESAPAGRDADELLAAVWGAGAADGDMLARLAFRTGRALQSDASTASPIEERAEGGYRLTLA